MRRVLYCGDRNWTDRQMVKRAMMEVQEKLGAHIVVHGAARGADTQANLVALGLGLIREAYPADWKRYGKGAGPIRNQQMLDTDPILVVAFKDGFNHKMDKGGTEDMVRRAVLAGVPTCLYAHDLDEAHTFAPHVDEAPALAARLQRLNEGGDPPTLWESVRDPDVPVTGVPFPSSQAAPPR